MKLKWIFITLLVFIFIYDHDRKFAIAADVAVHSARLEDVLQKSAQISMSEESREVALPSHLKLFGGQLAGHVFYKPGRRKFAVGMIQDEEGNILKPYPTQREVDFYNILENTENDPILEELKKYTPAYYGKVGVPIGKEVVPCIHMENLLKSYKKICSMDVKLGIRRIPPDAPPRKLEQELRYLGTMCTWGFGIPGFEYFKVTNGVQIREGKEYGYILHPKQAIRDLYDFVNGEIGIQCGLVASIVAQLRGIESWFQRQRSFRFFDSSVLLTYDAEKLAAFYEENKSKLMNGESTYCQGGAPVQVRMIDFGKVVPDTEDEEDKNYLHGLRSLIYIFENLSDLYSDQDTEKKMSESEYTLFGKSNHKADFYNTGRASGIMVTT